MSSSAWWRKREPVSSYISNNSCSCSRRRRGSSSSSRNPAGHGCACDCCRAAVLTPVASLLQFYSLISSRLVFWVLYSPFFLSCALSCVGRGGSLASFLPSFLWRLTKCTLLLFVCLLLQDAQEKERLGNGWKTGDKNGGAARRSSLTTVLDQQQKQQQLPRLPNMVTIDSIHEKKFVSLDSVLQVVILSVHLLPGTALSLSVSFCVYLYLPSHHPSGKTHPLHYILQVLSMESHI